MKSVSDALGVARSNLVERVGKQQQRRNVYKKPDDEWLLPRIRALVAGRASYGYRRVAALLTNELLAEGKRAINHKRVYRIMRANGLLLQRHTGKSPRTHEARS